MAYNSQNIKGELQGNGLIKEVRNRYLNNTNEMAQLAQEEYKRLYNDFTDIDFALDKLLTIEYEIYKGKEEQINDEFIYFADKIATVLNYPNVREALDDYNEHISVGKDPTTALRGVTYIITALADSNRQSRVSRSGASLMHHISYLLQKSGFVFEKDYQREYVLKAGCKLDFFFPDLKTYEIEPQNCCSVACQTTSNDRFRLTFAQMPNDTRNRACTAIGSTNFGDKLGPASLTDTKLTEAKKEGVKFVIIGSAIDKRLKDSNTVMSYNEWFNELTHLKGFYS